MKRVHAFEFGDLSWFPKNFRNYGTDYLQFAANILDLYKYIIPIIKKGIESSTTVTIVDIGSGGGGGLLKIARHLKKSIPKFKIILSDYHPNIDAFNKTMAEQPEVFEYIKESVNALAVPKDLKGFRTQFASLHHFKPKDAKAILQSAVDDKQSIGIFEPLQRDVKHIFQMLLSPISVLLLTPFIKPFKLDRIIFTYLIPILPLITVWDGVVSVMRTYTVKELKQMISEINNNESFNWDVGVAKGKQNEIIYLLGTPVNSK